MTFKVMALDSVISGLDIPSGWQVKIAYRDVRHLYFRADPGKMQISVSVPRGISPAALRAAIQSKAGWMAAQAGKRPVAPLVPQSLDRVDSVLFKGVSHPLSLGVFAHKPGLVFDPLNGFEIRVRDGEDGQAAARLLAQWFRACLKEAIEGLAGLWEPRIGVRAEALRVRQMKTRWGSCNVRAKRVWINLALICLAPDLLEYVLVHELVHLEEPGHTPRFYGLLGRHLPDWQDRRNRLKGFGPGLGSG